MKITAEFKNDNGNTILAKFDREAGTVSQGGKSSQYRRTSPTQIQITGDDTLTLTFDEEVKFEPGFSTRYSGSTGVGVVKILSVE